MGEYAEYAIDDGLASLFCDDCDETYDTELSVWPLPYQHLHRRSATQVFRNYRVPDTFDHFPDIFE